MKTVFHHWLWNKIEIKFMIIDTKTHAIPSVNYNKTKIAKTQIVIGSSLRADNNHLIRLRNSNFGKSKKWSTFTITRSGEVFQHFKSEYHSDFLGIKDVDIKIISIVLENMGYLAEMPDGVYINWINEVCPEADVEKKKWLGYDYWEKYSEEQINSLVLLCEELCTEHNIPKVSVDFNHYNKDIGNFRGITYRSNYIEDTVDINPLFNISNFNNLLESK